VTRAWQVMSAIHSYITTHKDADGHHALSGAAFDKAYADNEAAYHKVVDDALSNTLIPDAQNAELKSLLQSGLKIFQDHQRDAENIVKQLSVAHQ
jgi:predicted outer membrane protein